MIVGINAVNIKSGGGISHVENILTNLSREFLNKQKINKIILWCNPSLYYYFSKLKLYKKNINLIKIPDNFLYNVLWKIFFLYINLKKYNCDVLYSLDGVVLRKFRKVIILYQNLLPFSNYEIIRYGLSYQTFKLVFLRYIYYLSQKNADGVIYLNNYGKNQIENHIGKAKKSIIIPHGVSSDYISNIKKKLISKNNITNIIYISPIDLYKHQWNVVKAIELLIRENYNIKLHIVGFYSNKKAKNLFLKSYNELNNYKKNSVIYYGYLEKKAIISLLKKMDVFLFASSCESFGITLLEGVANKLPIFSSKMSGIPATIGNYAIYFDPLDHLNIYKVLKKNLTAVYHFKKLKNSYQKILFFYNWKKAAFNSFIFISKIFRNNYEEDKKNRLLNLANKSKLYKLVNRNIFNLLYLNSNFSIIIIFVLLYLFTNSSYSVEFLVVSTFILIVTQIFSSNIRNISVIDKNIYLLKYHFKFRLFISLIIILFSFFFKTYFFNDQNNFFHFSILIFILSFWICELKIAFNEIKKKYKDSLIIFYSYLFLYLIFIFSLNFDNKKNILTLYLIVCSLINIFYFSNFFILNGNAKKVHKIKYFQFDNFAFLSSLSLIISTFLMRFILSKEYDSNLVADVLICIAIANFPGSIITTTFGASYLNRDISLPAIFKYLFIFYTLLLCTAIILLMTNIYPSYNELIKNLVYSLFGGILMFYAQIIRILNVGILCNRQSVFIRDVLFSLGILFLLLTCILFNKLYLLYFSYSIFAILIYSFDYKLYAFKKKL
jgi:hypothetical protein